MAVSRGRHAWHRTTVRRRILPDARRKGAFLRGALQAGRRARRCALSAEPHHGEAARSLARPFAHRQRHAPLRPCRRAAPRHERARHGAPRHPRRRHRAGAIAPRIAQRHRGGRCRRALGPGIPADALGQALPRREGERRHEYGHERGTRSRLAAARAQARRCEGVRRRACLAPRRVRRLRRARGIPGGGRLRERGPHRPRPARHPVSRGARRAAVPRMARRARPRLRARLRRPLALRRRSPRTLAAHPPCRRAPPRGAPQRRRALDHERRMAARLADRRAHGRGDPPPPSLTHRACAVGFRSPGPCRLPVLQRERARHSRRAGK